MHGSPTERIDGCHRAEGSSWSRWAPAWDKKKKIKEKGLEPGTTLSSLNAKMPSMRNPESAQGPVKRRVSTRKVDLLPGPRSDVGPKCMACCGKHKAPVPGSQHHTTAQK